MENNVHSGGCHCGAVRYEVKTNLAHVISCNCSICTKTGSLLTFVPAEQFTLLSGKDCLSDYQFNQKRIHHHFCSQCGIRSFARGSTPDGKDMVAVNVRCIDDIDLRKITPDPFNGRSI